MPDYFSRYTSDELHAVWAELRAFGAVRETHPQYADIAAVVEETMRRIRYNLETIVANLQPNGYKFCDTTNEDRRPMNPLGAPDDESREFVRWFESEVGPLPLTVKAWIELVGDVFLLGEPEFQDADALVVEFEYRTNYPGVNGRDFVGNEREEWKAQVDDCGLEEVGPFKLMFSPDALHKNNLSGGPPYSVMLPDDSVDAIVEVDGEQLFFIDYLRRCLDAGGFPGLAGTEEPRGMELVEAAKKGLIRF